MTLTIGLILVALLLLALMGLHVLWTGYRARQARRRADADAAAAAAAATTLQGEVDPASLGGVQASVLWKSEPPRPQPLRRAPRIDALIDAIATLTPESPVSGDLILQHLSLVRRAGNKPLYVEGYHAQTDAWEVPSSGRRYTEVQVAVQLANRHGPLNEIDFAEFTQKAESLGEALRALVDLPDMIEAVNRARELDAFCSHNDVKLVVYLCPAVGSWSLETVQACAQRHGFVPSTIAGRMVLMSMEEDAPPVLVLSFDAQAALADDPGEAVLQHIALSLDVPQSPPEAEPFATWYLCARRLAEDLGAKVLDDQGDPLGLQAFESIGATLQTLYLELARHELAAGSAAARRLFS